MGVSSLPPLIKCVCLNPIAHYALLLSWIRLVNVAVPTTGLDELGTWWTRWYRRIDVVLLIFHWH